MLATQPASIDHQKDYVILDNHPSTDAISMVKSQLNELVLMANLDRVKLEFTNLSDLEIEHQPQNCAHHLNTCAREDDPLYEVIIHAKAAQSSTARYPVSQQIEFNIL